MPQLNILYADADLAVCIKPRGVASEADPTGKSHANLPGLLCAQLGGSFYPVHRLDTPVGGVTVLARSPKAAAALSAAFAAKTAAAPGNPVPGKAAPAAAEKTYLAVVCGQPSPANGTLTHYLYHDPRGNKTYAVSRPRKGVKPAVLSYRTLASAPLGSEQTPCALVAVQLHTGRTHQIRAQFAAEKLPLVGDGRYGSRVKTREIALWSAKLQFTHPVTGSPLCFTAPPPAEQAFAPFDPAAFIL